MKYTYLVPTPYVYLGSIDAIRRRTPFERYIPVTVKYKRVVINPNKKD